MVLEASSCLFCRSRPSLFLSVIIFALLRLILFISVRHFPNQSGKPLIFPTFFHPICFLYERTKQLVEFFHGLLWARRLPLMDGPWPLFPGSKYEHTPFFHGVRHGVRHKKAGQVFFLSGSFFWGKAIRLFNLYDFNGVTHPVWRQVDAAAVARRFYLFFNHLLTVYFKLYPGPGF